MSDKEQLSELIKTMKVPAKRRDLEDFGNILWLGRNLPIDNMEHPKLWEAMGLVNKLGKAGIRGILDTNSFGA